MNAKKLYSVSDLTKFIQKEVWNEDFHVKRVIDGDPEEQIVSGEVLGPLKPIGREGNALLLRGRGIYYSRFRAGDQIDLGILDPSSKKFVNHSSTSIKLIRFPEPGIIEVLVPGENTPLNAGDLFFLPKAHSGIKRRLIQKLAELEKAGIKAENHYINTIAIRRNFGHMSEDLNSTQKEALKFLVDNDFKGVVQGPPGTGKTFLLSALVNLATSSGMRVGLASLTHAAIDNALARLLKSGLALEDVVRIAGKKQVIRTEPYGDIDIFKAWVSSFSDFNGANPVYAATMHAWCMSNSTPEIDLLIIDEASQVPFYFHPLLEKLCSRVVMFGDHKQLPPVIQVTDHDLPADDIFSYHISQGKYPMLETQYRMNQWIQEWSANRFYNGQLKPHESVSTRDILRNATSSNSILGSKAVNLINHSGESENFANPTEAKKVVELVLALRAEGKLPTKEIGIVTPHRAQAGAICAELQQQMDIAEAQSILVDTVERFQGQEREAMIFSIGAGKDDSNKSGKAFLTDGRRLNVAVTRAKSRYYCFAPQKLVDRSLSGPDDSDLKSMLSWCGAKVGPHAIQLNTDHYVEELFDSGHKQFEHRTIAENHLKRRLKIGEQVHHINHIEHDNDPDNLCVLNKEDHESYHDWYRSYLSENLEEPSIEERLHLLKKLNAIFLTHAIKKISSR